MKFNDRSLAAGIAAVFLFYAITGCKKNNADNAGPQGISATVGGVAFQSTLTNNIFRKANGSYELYGILPKSPGDTLILFLGIPPTYILNKPIDVSVNGDIGFFNPELSTTNWYDASPQHGHGTITVTSLDTAGHRITGIFSGIAVDKDSLSVTNGRFNTTYIDYP